MAITNAAGTLSVLSSDTTKATVALAEDSSKVTITGVADGNCVVYVNDGTTVKAIKVTGDVT